jgi:transposase InsO family protein
MRTALVLDALEQAVWTRRRDGTGELAGLIHHNDAGSQGSTPRSRSPSGWLKPALTPRWDQWAIPS